MQQLDLILVHMK